MSLRCVILAGGLATRMRPATDRVPKTLLPVAGRTFADLQLEWLRSQGVHHVVYSIGFLGDAIRAHVGDGTRQGLHIEYVDEGDALRGTGGALRLVVDSGLAGDPFFVLNGDSYLNLDLTDVERTYRERGLPALMTVLRNRNTWDRSNAVFSDGRVVLYDKACPDDSLAECQWIDYGLSILRSQVIVDRVPSGATADIASVMRDLSVEGLLGGYEASERFYEIGSPEGLADLEVLLSARPSRDCPIAKA